MKLEKYFNFNTTVIFDNLQYIFYTLNYILDLINEFLLKSKELLKEGFKFLLEEIKRTIPQDETIASRSSSSYNTEVISYPIKLTLSTFFDGNNNLIEEIHPYHIPSLLNLVPTNIFSDLDNSFIILQSKEVPNLSTFQNKINPISLITNEILLDLNLVENIESFQSRMSNNLENHEEIIFPEKRSGLKMFFSDSEIKEIDDQSKK